MRDFRDAKAMAHTLRAALAAKDIKVTNSQSLELIAATLGVADWNTLSAAIRAETLGPHKSAASSSPPANNDTAAPGLSAEFHTTVQRALAHANRRKHEYATLEHLLLALIDDADASAVMKACQVDPHRLAERLAGYIDNELTTLVIADGGESKPTPAFQRVLRGAELYAQALGRPDVTGAQVLAGLFYETRSPAVQFLGEQGMTRDGAMNFIARGIVGGSNPDDASPIF